MSLSDKDGGTLLTYDVEAQIGGKLAQLGQRLINSAAKKTADDFFVKFAAAVGSPDDGQAPGAAISAECPLTRYVAPERFRVDLFQSTQIRGKIAPILTRSAAGLTRRREKQGLWPAFQGGKPCPPSH